MPRLLADDETRMARFGDLTPEEKAKVRAQQQADLKSATSERNRPLGSRIVDGLTELLPTPPGVTKAMRERAAEDKSGREDRYQTAKRRAEMSDEELGKEKSRYPTDRVLKLKDGESLFKRGGKVSSASKRADGIAQRGRTRGKYL